MIEDIEAGNDDKIEIRCSDKTKTQVKAIMADIDPNMTYEELLHAVIRTHRANPNALEKNAY